MSSAPGAGANFAFTLDLTSADARVSSPSAPLAGRKVSLLLPPGPTKTTLALTLRELGAEVQELAGQKPAGSLTACCDKLHDVIVDAAMAGEWTSRPQSSLAHPNLWLLLQSEERRRYRTAITSGAGYLLKPLRRSTLTRQLLDHDMLRLSEAVEQLRRTASNAGQVGALKIMLVEDDPINARLAIAMLSKAGHKVTHMPSGVKAVISLRAYLACKHDADAFPDLILMDVQMPGMSGLDTARQIRLEEAQHAMQPCPILALTANARAEDYDACMAAGMDGFLAKPFDRADLDEAIARLARRTAA